MKGKGSGEIFTMWPIGETCQRPLNHLEYHQTSCGLQKFTKWAYKCDQKSTEIGLAKPYQRTAEQTGNFAEFTTELLNGPVNCFKHDTFTCPCTFNTHYLKTTKAWVASNEAPNLISWPDVEMLRSIFMIYPFKY